jgi:hypothetical protein
MERVDVTGVNVMLDIRDATKHLKLAADGLEARNDFNSFESVKATCSAQGGGLWCGWPFPPNLLAWDILLPKRTLVRLYAQHIISPYSPRLQVL